MTYDDRIEDKDTLEKSIDDANIQCDHLTTYSHNMHNWIECVCKWKEYLNRIAQEASNIEGTLNCSVLLMCISDADMKDIETSTRACISCV